MNLRTALYAFLFWGKVPAVVRWNKYDARRLQLPLSGVPSCQ